MACTTEIKRSRQGRRPGRSGRMTAGRTDNAGNAGPTGRKLVKVEKWPIDSRGRPRFGTDVAGPRGASGRDTVPPFLWASSRHMTRLSPDRHSPHMCLAAAYCRGRCGSAPGVAIEITNDLGRPTPLSGGLLTGATWPTRYGRRHGPRMRRGMACPSQATCPLGAQPAYLTGTRCDTRRHSFQTPVGSSSQSATIGRFAIAVVPICGTMVVRLIHQDP